ncbi:alpha/beta fold hydrolase [Pseudomonas sp. FME51]|uniref:alpha/beta fold hydrolase n=1 Tax=Pseudomonas sp. FME51 TaxID=2742609 RepID=UPI001866D065|nr:alpha/beta hydrolase [Pseudomonas sp. FME51]
MGALRTQIFFNGEQKLAASVGGPEDGPGILFLHGGGQTRYAWNSCAETLAEDGFRVISLDLRGHGDSAWAADGYAIELQVQDVLAVISQFPEPPILVGASLGGLVALNTLGLHVRGGRALVLVDITPRIDMQGAAQVRDFMTANPEGFESLAQAAETISRYLPHRRRPESLSGLQKNLRMRNGRWYWHWDPALFFSLDVSKEAVQARHEQASRSITVPTLLIRGSRSELVGEDQVNHFLELIPHADFIDIQDAGHMVAGDSNEVFIQALREFVTSLPG